MVISSRVTSAPPKCSQKYRATKPPIEWQTSQSFASALPLNDCHSFKALRATRSSRSAAQRFDARQFLLEVRHTFAQLVGMSRRISVGRQRADQLQSFLEISALRRRIADIRRRWRTEGGGSLDGVSGLSGPLNFGVIRRALLPLARSPDVVLASHDPDGHLFVAAPHKSRGRGN